MWGTCKRYLKELSLFSAGSSELAQEYEEERLNTLVANMRINTWIIVTALCTRLVLLSVFDPSLGPMVKITGLVAIMVLVQETFTRIVGRLLSIRRTYWMTVLIKGIVCISVSIILVGLFASRNFSIEALRSYSVQLVATAYVLCVSNVISDMQLYIPLLLLLEVFELLIPYPMASLALTLPPSLTNKVLYFMLCLVREKSQRQSFILRQDVHKQKQTYAEFINNLPIPVVLFNALGAFYLNDAALSLGLTAQTSRDLMRRLECGNGSSLDSLLEQMLQDPKVRVVHREFVLKEARETKSYLVSAWASQADGITVAVTMIDITDTIQLQEKKAAEKYTNMLLYSLSHELRTPLNGIKGMFKSIENAYPQVRLSLGPNITRAKTGCMWLASQINNMLDYVQLITNEFAAHLMSMSIPSLLRKLKKFVITELGTRTKNVHVELVIPHDFPTYFEVDGPRLKQVCLNLLNVSTKTTMEGIIEISVAYNQLESLLVVTITDTSPGLSPGQLEQLFSLQPPSQETRDSRRLGRGFAISRMICEKLGGGIDVYSESDSGVTAVVRVRARATHPENAEEELGDGGDERTCLSEAREVSHATARASYLPAAHSEDSTNFLSGQAFRSSETLVLVVDDTELNRFVLCEMLKQYSLQVKTANNGLEAVEIVTRELRLLPARPMLIFLDLEMPVLDGIAAGKAIRELQGVRPPILVAATAFTAERERVSCTEAGFNYFLTKPIRAAELKSVLSLLRGA